MIYCELLKLKRSKICLIAFLGTLVTPLLVFLMRVKDLLSGSAATLFDFYDSAFVFLMPLFAPLLFSIVGVYLFSREYTEKTLKTVFVVSVSKGKFLIGKFITLFLCIMLLMLLIWAEILTLAIFFHLFFEVQQLTFLSAFYFLVKMIYGGMLLYAVVTPVVYLAICSKGFFAPVLAAAVITLADVILSGSPVAPYFPWTATYLLVTGRIRSYGCTPLTAHLIIGMVCLFSVCGSLIHFGKTDLL